MEPYINQAEIFFGKEKKVTPKINILAIDQASNCGWATKNAYGVWDFNTRKDESSGMKLLRFRAKLKEVCGMEGINLIVYERVAGKHAASIIHASKLVAVIESYCEENEINYKAVSAGELKRFATGNGNANKGKDDNEADAILIYHHTIRDLNLTD